MVTPLLSYGAPWERARQSVIDDIRGIAAAINARWAGQTPLQGTKVYYVADTSGGATTRKLTFVNGVLTAET